MVTLKHNVTHKDVITLKKLLNKHLGTKLDEKNNFYGDSTLKLVKDFQRKNGLIADGVVGALTWEVLEGKEKTCNCPDVYLTAVIATLATQVGVKEATGKNDGVAVEKFLKTVGLPKGYAWCQAFLYWGFSTTATTIGVPNPMPKTAGVLDGWRKSSGFQVKKGDSPQVGDVFTMDFGKGAGHCGIVTKLENGYIYTIEGNTSADPTTPAEDREGQGVYRRLRKISTINNGFIRYRNVR